MNEVPHPALRGQRVAAEPDDRIHIGDPVKPRVRVPKAKCERCNGTGLRIPTHYGAKRPHKPACPGCLPCRDCDGAGWLTVMR